MQDDMRDDVQDEMQDETARDARAPDETVSDNRDARRFEARVGDEIAVAEYDLVGDGIVFTHTEVPEALEGRGVGGRLVREALESARRRGLKVVPMCSFVAAYIRRHPDYLDLVDPAHRAALRM